MHVYDQPGSQMDEAVTAVVKAFKWRKSYGVENLNDSALNRLLREYTPRRKYIVLKNLVESEEGIFEHKFVEI